MDIEQMPNTPQPEEVVPTGVMQAAEDAAALARAVLSETAAPEGPAPAEPPAAEVPPSAAQDAAPVPPAAPSEAVLAPAPLSGEAAPSGPIAAVSQPVCPADAFSSPPDPPSGAPDEATAVSDASPEAPVGPSGPGAAVSEPLRPAYTFSSQPEAAPEPPEQAAQGEPDGRVQFAAPLYTLEDQPQPGRSAAEPVPSPLRFFLFDLVLNLPLVGLVLSLVWSFDEHGPLYRRNLSIGHLLALLTRGILRLVAVAALLAMLNSFLSSLPASAFFGRELPFNFSFNASDGFRSDGPERFFEYDPGGHF